MTDDASVVDKRDVGVVDKRCPLLATDSLDMSGRRLCDCLRDECAWWVAEEDGGECAVALMRTGLALPDGRVGATPVAVPTPAREDAPACGRWEEVTT